MNDFIPSKLPLDSLVIGTNGVFGMCAKCLDKFGGDYGEELTFMLSEEGILEGGDRFMRFHISGDTEENDYQHELRKSNINHLLFTYSGNNAEPQRAFGFYNKPRENGLEGETLRRMWDRSQIYIFPEIRDYLISQVGERL